MISQKQIFKLVENTFPGMEVFKQNVIFITFFFQTTFHVVGTGAMSVPTAPKPEMKQMTIVHKLVAGLCQSQGKDKVMN